MSAIWIEKFFDNLKKNFRKKIASLKENYKIHDIIFLFVSIGFVITIYFTKFFYPFNRYSSYSDEAAALVSSNVPPFIYTVLMLLLLALIFTCWSFLSVNKIRFIIPFFGFILCLMGPFAQNTFYSTDSLYQVGVILRLSDLASIPPIKIFHYTGLLYHRIFYVPSLLFTAFNTILYIAPILIFMLQIPLGDKLIKLSDNWKIKTLIGFSYYSFPLVLSQKFSTTPYSLLIGLVSLLLFLVPFETKKKKLAAIIISIVCIFVHIHGVIVFFIIILYLTTHLGKKSRKFKTILNFSVFSVILIPYFLVLILQEQIDSYIRANLYGLEDYTTIQEVFRSLTYKGGYLTVEVLPKILEGGGFAIWYIIQILIFIVIAGCGIYFTIRRRYQVKKDKKTVDKLEDKGENEKEETKDLLEAYGSITAQFSISILIGLFVGTNLHLFRLQYFTLLIGPFLFIYLLMKYIIRIPRYAFLTILFVYLSASPLIIYNQYTPYQESEFELIEWVNNYYYESNETVVVITHQHLFKLMWVLVNENVTCLQWGINFWRFELLENDVFFLKNQDNSSLAPYNILIVFSSRIIAQEYQFNNVTITSKIDDVRNYYNYIFHSFKDIYIYEINIKVKQIWKDFGNYSL